MLVLLLEVGNFQLDPASYLFYNLVTVVFTILLYHMYGGWFAGGWLGQGCWYVGLSADTVTASASTITDSTWFIGTENEECPCAGSGSE